MQTNQDISTIQLHPGEVRFTKGNASINTLLGSCVAITVWHPVMKIGGMCHYMIPQNSANKFHSMDGRHAEGAMELILNEMKKYNAPLHEYQVKIFGGGIMFPDLFNKNGMRYVGDDNIKKARELIHQLGLNIHAEDTGGIGHRTIRFNVSEGAVWVKQSKEALP